MTVSSLCKQGHDVKDIRGTTDMGLDDDLIWHLVIQEKRLLITTDKGFAQYRNSLHFGILIVRLRQPNRLKIHQRILKGLHQFNEQEWPGLVLIMRDSVQSVFKNIS